MAPMSPLWLKSVGITQGENGRFTWKHYEENMAAKKERIRNQFHEIPNEKEQVRKILQEMEPKAREKTLSRLRKTWRKELELLDPDERDVIRKRLNDVYPPFNI